MFHWIMGLLLIASSLSVILSRKPIYSCLSFLMTLLLLSVLYLELSAEFISVMQILVYAGAILVIFMFVVVLFQDAHQKIEQVPPKSNRLLITTAASAFTASFFLLGVQLLGVHSSRELPDHYGFADTLGFSLYVDYFFPFEAIILLFMVAVVGALYIGKREIKQST